MARLSPSAMRATSDSSVVLRTGALTGCEAIPRRTTWFCMTIPRSQIPRRKYREAVSWVLRECFIPAPNCIACCTPRRCNGRRRDAPRNAGDARLPAGAVRTVGGRRLRARQHRGRFPRRRSGGLGADDLRDDPEEAVQEECRILAAVARVSLACSGAGPDAN